MRRRKNKQSAFLSPLKAGFGRQITLHCIFVLLLRRTLDSLRMVAFSFFTTLLLMALLKTSHQSHRCSGSSPGCFLGSSAYQSWGLERLTSIFLLAVAGSRGCVCTPTANRPSVFKWWYCSDRSTTLAFRLAGDVSLGARCSRSHGDAQSQEHLRPDGKGILAKHLKITKTWY